LLMIKRFYTTLFLYFAFTAWVNAQTIVGSWSGPIKLPQGDLPFVLNVSGTTGNYKATADSPAQNSYGMPIDILMFDGEVLRFSSEKLEVKYEGTIVQPDSISGDFVQNGATFPLGFRKIGGEEILSKEEEIQEEVANEEVIVQKEVTEAIGENISDNEIAAKI